MTAARRPFPLRRRAVHGRTAVLLILAAASPLPPAAQAWAQAAPGATQEGPQPRGTPFGFRQWLLAAAGMAVGAVPAMLATGNDDGRGACSSKSCTIAVSGLIGGTIGFLIGRELDQKAAITNASGPSINLRSQPIDLDLVPVGLSAYSAGAVVIGQEGIATVGADRMVRRRGGSMRGVVAATAVPEHDVVLAATATGLFSFPLQGDASEGRLVLQEGGAALAASDAGDVIFGGSDVLRRLRLAGRAGSLEAVEEARVTEQGAAAGLAYAAREGLVWSLSRDRVFARSAAQLQELGSIALPAMGRSLSLSGQRALVAAGSSGLFILNTERPEAPTVAGHIRGITFAFDAVLMGDVAYVAAGRTGLLVVNVSDPTRPQLLGAARDLGFVIAVEQTPDGRIYAIDREGRRLFVVEPNSREPGS